MIVWNEKHLRLAISAAEVGLWSWNVDTEMLALDDRACSLWHIPPSAGVMFDELACYIDPSDRDRVRAGFSAARGIVGSFEIDFRILVKEEIHWISARGQGDDADNAERVMFGVFLDVTGRKQAEESHELLAGEMSHRVKNLLAVAAALTHITSRSVTTSTDMARELIQRLTALGRAQDLVRPVPGQKPDAALLGDILTLLLAPYDECDGGMGRVRVSVPRIAVGPAAATTLALIVHELATNSLKYGALSTATGLLDVSCTVVDAEVLVIWTERGGPPVLAPESRGFGSKLVTRSMTRQLGGSLDYNWDASGLIVTLRMASAALTT